MSANQKSDVERKLSRGGRGCMKTQMGKSKNFADGICKWPPLMGKVAVGMVNPRHASNTSWSLKGFTESRPACHQCVQPKGVFNENKEEGKVLLVNR